MRNLRKKFKRPKKSWNIEAIEERKAVKNEYGLRATKELLIARELLRRFRTRARQLIAVANEDEKRLLIGKLAKLGMLKPGAGLDDVLVLSVNNILDRRLQTLVFKKGMASSVKHARQLITHGRVSVNGVRIKFPSYIVTADEEAHIGWYKGEPKRPEGPKRKAAPRKGKAGEGEGGKTAEVAEEGKEEEVQIK